MPALQIKDIRTRLKPFTKKDNHKAFFQLLLTLVAFILMLSLSVYALNSHMYFIYTLTLILSAIFNVRLFLIQHDCGHGSFFKQKIFNLWIGRTMGLLTLTPYAYWRHEHHLHHKDHGNLDKRGTGDIWLMTTTEYAESSPTNKLIYRAYRSVISLLIIGPAFVFIIKNRIPQAYCLKESKLLKSYLITNVFVAILWAVIIYNFGLTIFFLNYLLMVAIGASIGVFLFYVQHNFEEPYWQQPEEWNFADAAFKGSTTLIMGRVMDFLTLNIAYHGVHHFNHGIPCYNLKAAYKNVRNIIPNREISLITAIKCYQLKLWDQEKQMMVGF